MNRFISKIEMESSLAEATEAYAKVKYYADHHPTEIAVWCLLSDRHGNSIEAKRVIEEEMRSLFPNSWPITETSK